MSSPLCTDVLQSVGGRNLMMLSVRWALRWLKLEGAATTSPRGHKPQSRGEQLTAVSTMMMVGYMACE